MFAPSPLTSASSVAVAYLFALQSNVHNRNSCDSLDADIPLILDSPTTTAGETTPILVATAAEPSAHGQSVPRQRAHTGVSPSLQGQRSHTGVLGPSPQNQAVWRQRSHTGVTSSRCEFIVNSF